MQNYSIDCKYSYLF